MHCQRKTLALFWRRRRPDIGTDDDKATSDNRITVNGVDDIELVAMHVRRNEDEGD